MLKWENQGNIIKIDLEDNVLIFNDKTYLLEEITNQALLDMCSKKAVYLSEDFYADKKILYRCVRKLVQRKNSRQVCLYIDIVVYESALEIVGKNIFTRSLGHVNDTKEIEIHQVLCGKILELIIYRGNSYIGVFGENEYFEIPAGAFHCSYVLADNTIVANIFGNVYWESNYTLKPYGQTQNGFSFEKCNDHLAVRIEGGGYYEFMENHPWVDEVGLLDYKDLPGKALKISSEFSLDHDIFSLLNKIINCE